MIERRDHRPPVTYTTFQARDLGGDTADLFKAACARRLRALPPEAMIVGASLHGGTDPGRSRRAGESDGPADPGRRAGTAAYQKQGELGRGRDLLPARPRASPPPARPGRSSATWRRAAGNILGPTALGFRHRDDVTEVTAAAEPPRHRCERGGAAGRRARRTSPGSPTADFNVVLYPETAEAGGRWLEKTYGQPVDEDRAHRRRRDARLHRRGRAARRRRPPRPR